MTLPPRATPRPQPAEQRFWWFVAERHAVFIRRVIERRPPPWTEDPAIGGYHYTNCYRELDRGTRTLRRDVLDPSATAPPADRLFNVLVFRIVRPETYAALGGYRPAAEWDLDAAEGLLRARMAAGESIFPNAYRIRSGRTPGPGARIPQWVGNLRGARGRLPGLWAELERTTADPDRRAGMRRAHAALADLRDVGPFLAYEILTDCGYAPAVLPYRENDWVNIGPGAAQGLAALGLPPTEASVRALAARQREGLARVGRALRGPDLTLRNIEHCCCEFSKYEKARAGGHMKRRYRPRVESHDFTPWEGISPEYWTAPRPEGLSPARHS